MPRNSSISLQPPQHHPYPCYHLPPKPSHRSTKATSIRHRPRPSSSEVTREIYIKKRPDELPTALSHNSPSAAELTAIGIPGYSLIRRWLLRPPQSGVLLTRAAKGGQMIVESYSTSRAAVRTCALELTQGTGVSGLSLTPQMP